MDTLAAEGVEVDRKRRHEGLALACFHLGDFSLVEHHAPDDLDVELAHINSAAARLPNDGESLHQEIDHRLALLEPLAEFGCLCPELLVAHGLHRGLKGADGLNDGLDAPKLTNVLGGNELADEVGKH